jgi:hypothetical protein
MLQTLRTHSGKLITLGLLGASPLISWEATASLILAVLAYNGLLSPFRSRPDDNSEPDTEPEGYPDWVRAMYPRYSGLSQFAGKSYDHICNYILNNKQPS